MPEEVVARLIRLWHRLPSAPPVQAEPTGLGYRSCSLSGPDGRRWVAFEGVVRLDTTERVEQRRDADRAFERALLASAPAGLLPRA